MLSPDGPLSSATVQLTNVTASDNIAKSVSGPFALGRWENGEGQHCPFGRSSCVGAVPVAISFLVSVERDPCDGVRMVEAAY
jgi:hypothetical protein